MIWSINWSYFVTAGDILSWVAHGADHVPWDPLFAKGAATSHLGLRYSTLYPPQAVALAADLYKAIVTLINYDFFFFRLLHSDTNYFKPHA